MNTYGKVRSSTNSYGKNGSGEGEGRRRTDQEDQEAGSFKQAEHETLVRLIMLSVAVVISPFVAIAKNPRAAIRSVLNGIRTGVEDGK